MVLTKCPQKRYLIYLKVKDEYGNESTNISEKEYSVEHPILVGRIFEITTGGSPTYYEAYARYGDSVWPETPISADVTVNITKNGTTTSFNFDDLTGSVAPLTNNYNLSTGEDINIYYNIALIDSTYFVVRPLDLGTYDIEIIMTISGQSSGIPSNTLSLSQRVEVLS